MDKQKFCENLSEWVQIPNNESCFITIAWYPSGRRKEKTNHDRDFYSKWPMSILIMTSGVRIPPTLLCGTYKKNEKHKTKQSKKVKYNEN